MKAVPSFSKAIGDAIEPLGFKKIDRNEWERRVGDYLDTVYLTVSRDLTKVTAELWLVDMSVHDVIQEANPPRDKGVLRPIAVRPGQLMGAAQDVWWKRDDPDARGQMIYAILTYAIPFFDSLHTLEAMRDYLERNGGRGRNNALDRMHLAVILDRLGQREEACDLLYPPGKTVPQIWLDRVAGLRKHLCEPNAPLRGYLSPQSG